ncbi:MAG TPA: penicillin acylase family protein, partial [Bacteroidota bacterium]|nr:penicillin acylase family protein [Bacteroidota bacterium]
MPKYTKLLLGIALTIVVIVAAVIVFLHFQVTKSFPETHGTVTLSILHAPVDVYRDEFGIPHIVATDEHDLMVATGYVHAQDRLWQMDIGRRAGEGRLAEIFDTSALAFDKLFRTLRFAALADSLEQHLHPESRAMLQEYADGVNAYIDSHQGKFPVEFDMLRYQPEHWEVKHSLLLARLMAWELNFAWWVDLSYAEIAAKVPADKFKEILPTWPDSIPPIIGQPVTNISPVKKLSRPKKTALDDQADQGRALTETDVESIHNLLTTVRNYRELFNMGTLSAGSNAWVVSGAKSVTGKPLLANDPHLKFGAPSRWYEMHLSAPGWNVEGVTIPGAPVVVIGHNDSLAWGMTNAMLDDADFYSEKLDSSAKHYSYRDSTFTTDPREETIYIGTRDSIEFVTRATKHGPIVTDVHPVTRRAGGDSLLKANAISMKWTGYEMSDELYGFYLMDR